MFGLRSSGPIFSKLLLQAIDLEPSLHPYLCIYADDICLATPTIALHLELLEKLFIALRKANFKLSPAKSKFFQAKVDFVGHTFSREGVRPKADKLSALFELPIPKTKKS